MRKPKKIFGWNIDLTHQCLLRCSGCGRTQDLDLINPRTHLTLEDLSNFFTNPKEQVDWMEFEGCFGDPIYNPEFHEIAEYFFDVKRGMGAVTNGMHRTDFWERILETWPTNSRLMLSIDGLEDTNHIYRVNSKWESIQRLLDLIATKKRKCQIEWKFIVFKHNAHQIEEARTLAEKIGIDVFQIKQARQGDYLEKNGLERVQLDEYFHHDEKWFNPINKEILEPNCHTGDMHHITAYGNYRPCINFVHADQNIKSWPHEIGKHLPNYNIRDYSFEEINELFFKFSKDNLQNGIENAPNLCQLFCKKIETKTINGSPNCAINRTRIQLTQIYNHSVKKMKFSEERLEEIIYWNRLNSMSDWQEFHGFDAWKVKQELEKYKDDWVRYNPKKPNNRWGLSVTSLDGGLSGIPDLTSLKDWELQTGEVLTNHDIKTPTKVWTENKYISRLLEPWKPWVTRCHFLRMDRGSFFPDHHDINKIDTSYDEVRLTAFVDCDEYNFKWIYDDKIIKCNPGSVWYFNANKRHSVHSTRDGVIILVICLAFDKHLFEYMQNNAMVS